jgi:hypothetical protein
LRFPEHVVGFDKFIGEEGLQNYGSKLSLR